MHRQADAVAERELEALLRVVAGAGPQRAVTGLLEEVAAIA
jgi:hypothetical protein